MHTHTHEQTHTHTYRTCTLPNSPNGRPPPPTLLVQCHLTPRSLKLPSGYFSWKRSFEFHIAERIAIEDILNSDTHILAWLFNKKVEGRAKPQNSLIGQNQIPCARARSLADLLEVLGWSHWLKVKHLFSLSCILQ